MPILEELADATSSDVEVLGLALNDRPEDVQEMVDRLGITYVVGVDDRGEASLAFGVQHLPTTVVLDSDGEIAAVHHGKADRADLDDLLAAVQRSDWD
jgi:peroxiredoxin